MKLTVIGCDGAYPRVNGATSAYLIEDKGTNVLLDCGSGAISRLQNHIELKDLSGIVISHYHADHIADLECMQYAAMIETFSKLRKEPLIIYGPGEEQRLTYKSFCVGNTYKKKDSFTIGTLTFTTIKNIHAVEAYSIKVTNEEGKTIVYTGDTGYYKELSVFSKKADILIAEASLYANEHGKISGHMTSIEAATVAKEADVNTLIVTHLPHTGNVEELAVEAKSIFEKKVLLAQCDLAVEV